jgi:hypothetical protein
VLIVVLMSAVMMSVVHVESRAFNCYAECRYAVMLLCSASLMLNEMHFYSYSELLCGVS